MARAYEEVVDTSYLLADTDLKLFAEALTIQAKKDNEELNVLLAKNKKNILLRSQ